MMKKKQILFILIMFYVCSSIKAQYIRFMYEYRSVPDTLQKDSIIKEVMFLDVLPNKKSIFYNGKRFISDSTMKADAKKGVITMPDKTISTYYIIKKNYADSKTTMVIDDLSTILKFLVDENVKLDWKILTDKQLINGYDCQKATVAFGGRFWYAWFTNYFPFNDGPYKFQGLPGLIVKIEDAQRYHIFQLKGVKKINQDSLYEDNVQSNKNIKRLSKDKFIAFYRTYRKDPAREFRQKAMNGMIYYESDEKRREHIIMVEKLREEKILHDNNIIEINWIK
ncbi:GLPGLI family protein [Chryseobacterium cucumeris]|uniref:GLPGLI family protein n=1 Tax=Chryseobacterium sp. CP-77 TaxID=3116594 RepID=UPI002ED1C749